MIGREENSRVQQFRMTDLLWISHYVIRRMRKERASVWSTPMATTVQETQRKAIRHIGKVRDNAKEVCTGTVESDSVGGKEDG